MLLPPCEAVMVQRPAPVRWTLEPAMLQFPAAEKVTLRLEEAVALTAKSGSPNVLLDNPSNVIVWSADNTVKVDVPLLVTYPLSPANAAETPLG